jgi:hypothetical protein
MPWVVATAYRVLASTSQTPIASSAASTRPRAAGIRGRAYSATTPSNATLPTFIAATVDAGSLSAAASRIVRKSPNPSAATTASPTLWRFAVRQSGSGSWATAITAGSAITAPTVWSPVGSSPRARPKTTGTTIPSVPIVVTTLIEPSAIAL